MNFKMEFLPVDLGRIGLRAELADHPFLYEEAEDVVQFGIKRERHGDVYSEIIRIWPGNKNNEFERLNYPWHYPGMLIEIKEHGDPVKVSKYDWRTQKYVQRLVRPAKYGKVFWIGKTRNQLLIAGIRQDIRSRSDFLASCPVLANTLILADGVAPGITPIAFCECFFVHTTKLEKQIIERAKIWRENVEITGREITVLAEKYINLADEDLPEDIIAKLPPFYKKLQYVAGSVVLFRSGRQRTIHFGRRYERRWRRIIFRTPIATHSAKISGEPNAYGNIWSIV